MTVQQRIEAISRFQEHEAEGYRQAAEWDRQRKEDLTRWKDLALQTIIHFVQEVSEDFAERGSPFLFSSIPVQTQDSALFRTKTSGGARLPAKLQFDLANGRVTATATGVAVHLPSSVSVRGVTREWVELAAESVLIATLNDCSQKEPQAGAQ